MNTYKTSQQAPQKHFWKTD